MTLFIEISAILAVAAAISIIMKILRQPIMIGYIITGLVVGPYFLGVVKTPEAVDAFAELGIALLLFIVGLNLSPKVIKEVGKVSLFTGMAQVFFTYVVSYSVLRLMHFELATSLYLAIGLTLSSTIIVLKILSDKNALDKLHGKITTGFLIFQDIVAAIALIVSSSFSSPDSSVAYGKIILMILGTVVGTALVIGLAKLIIPMVGKLIAKSREVLFIFTLGWGLSIASIFYITGLSLEVGALVAGISLAMFPYHHEMSARMRPLRDFFLILFFVFLGTQISLGSLGLLIKPALILSTFVIIGNPLIVMIIMGLFGYRKRTSFLSAITVAQVSEFSFILLALGMKNGHVDQEALSLITLIGIITMTVSTYLIYYSEKLYRVFKPALKFFEKSKTKEEINDYSNSKEAILFGCRRLGWDFVEIFMKNDIDFLVVDMDPEIIADLKSFNVPVIYGDAEDLEFLESLNFNDTNMIVSTIPSIDINKNILRRVKEINEKAIVVMTAHQISEADELYNSGADYVVMPYFLGSSYASEIVSKYRFSKEAFAYEKTKHRAYLDKKSRRGHEHPLPENLLR